MITGKDCRMEFAYAKKVVKTEEGKALLKTNEINNKVLLNIRLMLSKVMEALKIEKIVTKVVQKERDWKRIYKDGTEVVDLTNSHYNNPSVSGVKADNKGKIDIVK